MDVMEDIMLIEMSQERKDKYHILTHLWKPKYRFYGKKE
jgi:hypothetical protein